MHKPHDKEQDSAQAVALARAASAAMLGRDNAARAMGIALEDVGPGHARMTMTVRTDMLNGHQSCHGGFIFALADTAFAFACNSYNQITVGAGCHIDYLAPGHLHDVLTADAREQALAGKSGIYDVRVSNQEGRLIALFRGKSHRIGGELTAA